MTAERALRIAWTGTVGVPQGAGVAGISWTLLSGLADRGHHVDAFVADPGLDAAAATTGITFVHRGMRWSWGRWYSRHPVAAFGSSMAARAAWQRRVAQTIGLRHQAHPYDVIFQMSQLETFLGRTADEVPLVVHPCTIATLEQKWHWTERRLALQGEGRAKFLAVDAALRARALVQRRHFRRPDLLLGPSERFNRDLLEEGLADRRQLRVLRHPLVPGNTTADAPFPREDGPVDLLFVSRMSSRKGVELIAALSHRLADLQGSVRITLIGGTTLWSDYRAVLQGLNFDLATYIGEINGEDVRGRMRRAAALLVPSRFEPGSIATGEALSAGLPVIASSAVGPSEIIDDTCGRVFADGDVNAFESAVRSFLHQWRTGSGGMRDSARRRAIAHLGTGHVVRQLEDHLREAVALAPPTRRGPRP